MTGCGRKLGPYDCCTVVCGDCLELMKSLPDGCVDAVITDPPYPGYEKGWMMPDVQRALTLPTRIKLVFWPTMTTPPLAGWTAENIWHKPNGCSAFHYEKIYVYGDVPKTCRVYREACILPNYVQYAAECVEHPTQKPLGLLVQLFEEYTEKAETILDPFLGSGTTAVAAKKLGRHFLGFEISPEYCRIAEERIRLVEMQPQLFEKKPEQLVMGN